MRRRQPLREPLGKPGAARIDADERGVVCDGALHALDELRERRFGVGQVVRGVMRVDRTMPAG